MSYWQCKITESSAFKWILWHVHTVFQKVLSLQLLIQKYAEKKVDCSEQEVIPSHCFHRITVYSLEGIKYFLNSLRHYGDSHYLSMNS